MVKGKFLLLVLVLAVGTIVFVQGDTMKVETAQASKNPKCATEQTDTSTVRICGPDDEGTNDFKDACKDREGSKCSSSQTGNGEFDNTQESGGIDTKPEGQGKGPDGIRN